MTGLGTSLALAWKAEAAYVALKAAKVNPEVSLAEALLACTGAVKVTVTSRGTVTTATR